MQRILRIVALGTGVLVLVCGSVRAAEVGTAFSYQGQLVLDGTPVNDNCEFVFILFDRPVGGVGDAFEPARQVEPATGLIDGSAVGSLFAMPGTPGRLS